MKSRKIATVLLTVLLLGCQDADEPNATPAARAAAESAAWDEFRATFIEGFLAMNPSFAVDQGRHEYDGQIGYWTDQSFARQIAFLRAAIDGAATFDRALLTEAQSFEHDYLNAVARRELFWLEDADQPHTNITWYFDNGLDPNVYIARPYADAATRLRAFVAYARALPAAIEQIRANVRTPMPASFLEYGLEGFTGLTEYFAGDVQAAFAGVEDPGLRAELTAAIEAASAATNDAAEWLESERATATQDFALGAERFARMLEATEGVTVPLDQLEVIGRADLERNQAALRDACATFAPDETLGACMLKMQANKPPAGPVAAAREQLPSLRQFIIDHDLASIPGMEEALVAESPPYNRQNSVYIDIPGPYETGLPSTYYIAPPDPSWTPDEQLGYIMSDKDLLYSSVHEVWPGHFLNFLHANRAPSSFGRVFVGYAYAEGWGHYAEELMWEAGFENDSAESHIGQLSNALLRNCRYVSAIGLHARGMSLQQSYELFRNECFQDEANSRQQAARGTYDPAYLNYTLGKLMIRKLRDDWTATRGGRAAWKEFHDAFLRYGGPPIPLVRRAMLGDDSPVL